MLKTIKGEISLPKENGYQNSLIIGIDIGGTYFRIGAVDLFGKVLDYKMDLSQKISLSHGAVDALANIISEYIKKFNENKILMISIGFPSTISKDRRVVYQTPNLSGFDNIRVPELLEERLHIPVVIDRDVNHLLLYEMNLHRIPKEDISLGIFFGSGIGNSLYFNGDFWRGKHGVACEAGHFHLLGKNDKCGCGNTGCMERYAAGRRLGEIAETIFPNPKINDLFIEYASNELLIEFVQIMCVLIVAELNIFDPDYLILGGGILNMPGFPLNLLKDEIQAHVRKPYPGNDYITIFANGKPENGILGAAYSVLRMPEYGSML